MPPEEEKVTESRPVEPVVVTVIQHGDASRLTSDTVGKTLGANVPNLVTQVVTPMRAIVIRFIYLFMTTLTGFLSLKMAPDTQNMVIESIKAADFYTLVVVGSSVALSSAMWGAFKDFTTIIGGLEKKYPLASGSV